METLLIHMEAVFIRNQFWVKYFGEIVKHKCVCRLFEVLHKFFFYENYYTQ